MKLASWAISSAGRRSENQDAIILPVVGLARESRIEASSVDLSDRGVIAAIADGVGGRPGGRWAAETAVKMLTVHCDISGGENELRRAIAYASQEIASRNERGAAPATTIAGMLATRHELLLFHVGDSRIYSITDSDVILLTADHRSRTSARSITRFLGSQAHAVPDIMRINPPTSARFLIATDGLYAFVRKSDLSLFRDLTPEAALATLVETALEGGSDDNLSALYVEIR